MWNVNDPRLFWNRAQDEGFLKQSRTNQIGPLEMENKDSVSNCAHGLIQRNTQISILIAPKDVHTLLVSWSATQDFFFC